MGKTIIRGSILLLGITLLTGFYIRIESFHGTEVIDPLRADAGHLFMYAYNLRHHNTYSRDVATLEGQVNRISADAIQPPGYPLFLSIFIDGPPNIRMIKKILLFQVIISTLTLLVAYFFFKSFLSNYWAVLAVVLTALCPQLIVANSYILTESLFCFLLVLSMWLLSLFVIQPLLWMGVICGLVLGVATLVRPGLQYFPLVVGILFLLHHGSRKGSQFFVALSLGFVLALSPWTIRNLKTLNVMSDKMMRINFLQHGMYPNLMYKGLAKSYGYPYRYDPKSSEIAKNTESVLKEIANRFSREPVKHLKWYIIKKPTVFWSWDIIQGQGDVFVYHVSKTPYLSEPFFKWTHRLMHYFHWPLVLLCGFGSLIVWIPAFKKKYSHNAIYAGRIVSALLIYFTVIHMIGTPFPRYSIPLRPFLYSMAMFSTQFIFTNIGSWLSREK